MYLRSSLSRKPGRTVLVAVAIALAIALSLNLLSFGAGLREGYTSILEERGTDIYVGGEGSNPLFGGMNLIDNGTDITENIASMDGVRASIPVFTGHISFFALNEDMWIAENGSGLQRIQPFGVVAGGAGDFVGADRALLDGEGLRTPGDPRYAGGEYDGVFTGEIVISENMALFLDVSTGDHIYINSFLPTAQNMASWMDNATRFEITAVGDLGGRRAVMHMSELREMSGFKGDEVSEIRVDIFDPTESERLAAEITSSFQVSAFTVDEIVGETDRFISSFKGIANVISILAVLVAGVFVATIMDISVQEKKREMGLLRAIGFSSRSMLAYTMSYSLVITGFGCLLGILFGYITIGYVEDLLFSRFGHNIPSGFAFSKVTPGVLMISIAMALCVAVIAGLFAYRRVMAIRVSEVLHGD